MKRQPPDDRGEPLFDLPLDQGAGTTGPRPNAPALETPTQPPLPLEEPVVRQPVNESESGGNIAAAAALDSLPKRRVQGGLLDLGVHALVVGLAVAGSWWLGVAPPNLTLWPLVVFGVGFSFVYHVLPLVFWGQTPGMARSGLIARSADGKPLTMGQAVLRWLGALLCAVSLGVLLLFGIQRTISDRLSASIVHAAR